MRKVSTAYAYSDAVKQKTIELIKQDLGQVDLVVYSLAAPRRTHPKTGEVFNSALKPIGKSLTTRGLNTDKETITDVSLEPASQEEIDGTVAVMGGEDWQMWIDALLEAGVLAEGAKTTAFTYLGEKITHDIYWNGSIGEAKRIWISAFWPFETPWPHTATAACVSVLKAVVTQASSAIPVMPLYLSLLFKVMKEKGTHEGCIEQVYGLFKDSLYNAAPIIDETGRLRADYKELQPEVQEEVSALWPTVSNENLNQLTDFVGYKTEFMHLFGFGLEGVDYEADVDPDVKIKNLVQM